MIDREWLDQPAVTRISAASASALRPFLQSYNSRRPFADQVKPFNFLICVQVAPFSHPAGYQPERFQLVTPFESNPRRWLQLKWTDIYSGDTFRIHTTGPPSPHSVKVQTNRNVLDRYRTHPEPKSLGPDLQPCDRQTRGLLQRRPVLATEISYIGKESNRLEETTAGLIHDPAEILSHYADPALDPWHTLVIPTLRRFNRTELARRACLDRRTIQRLLNGRSSPRRSHRNMLTTIAAELARSSLLECGLEPARAPLATLALYRDKILAAPARCVVCLTPLLSHRAKYCGKACKKRAYRTRTRSRSSLAPARGAPEVTN
jgi:hypothetical protein